MVPHEMTLRALLAANVAKVEGFHATAEAFLMIARDFAFYALEAECSPDWLSWNANGNVDAQVGVDRCSI